MSLLHIKQVRFAFLLPRLIDKAFSLGFEVAGGEWQRSQREATALAAEGKGIVDSLHIKCLAVDLKLFRGGVYLTDTEEYEPLGVFWEGQSTADIECAWGGRFKTRPDGGHFSIEHGGVR